MTEMLAGKKVLFIITKSNWGGVQVYVHALAKQAKEAGANVVVATGGTGLPNAPTGLLVTHLKEAGVRVILVPSFMRNISLWKEASAFFELIKILKQERPDVLHLNSSKASGLGALAGRVAGIKNIVFTAHGWPHREPRPLWQRILIWKLSWLTILFSHTIIVVSKSDYNASPVLFSKRKIHLVHNGIAPFTTLPRDVARLKIQAQGTFWFLIIAELHKNKSIDTALRAFALVHKTHPETAFVSIGAGEELQNLKDLTEKLGLSHSVTFAGFVSDARSYLSCADCVMLPSRKEGLPISLLEAGIAHSPVIATTVGGIPELIENEKTGLLVPPQNTQKLADAMERMLESQSRRDLYGEALYEHVTKEFSETEMVHKTFALY